MSENKFIPDNCDIPLMGRGDRRCKKAGTVETKDGRMICGHHAKMIADEIIEERPGPP